MKILGINFGKNKGITPLNKSAAEYMANSASPPITGSVVTTWSVRYDGEKNTGEIGPIRDYTIDFLSLSTRSYQAYLESDIAKIIISKYVKWIISKGLSLNSNPSERVLAMAGIKINAEDFNNDVEARFKIWAKSKRSSYSGEKNFHSTTKDVFVNSRVGGDCLVILRYIDNIVKVQVVDGRHVQTPSLDYFDKGNNIKNGVEKDKTGKHIAYHIRSSNFEYQRIPAYDKTTGLRVSFLVYGSTYRLEDDRGLPVIAVSLETISKNDRYKEAAVASAEERAKIPYFIEHGTKSDGENPLGDFGITVENGPDDGSVPVDAVGNVMANTISSTTSKMTFNMPVDSTIKALDSKSSELGFKDFYGTINEVICSSVGIPPNVAFSVYNDSFSASRAATKDWDHTMEVDRDNLDEQYNSYVYAFWFHMEVISSKIQAPGYIFAHQTNDWMTIEAFLNAEFTGPMFPHIDPVKEVKAERMKLGPLGDNINLTTIEEATKRVGSGESKSNMEQFSRELDDAERLGIYVEEVIPVVPSNEE